jgi:DNA modification methylase
MEAPRNQVLQGDALETLRSLPSRSAQCIITSPPYYALRDYGVEGQIGLEPSLEAYFERLLPVFDELHRVLRLNGTLWLNIGDSYANDEKWGGATGGKHAGGLHGEPVGRARRKTGLKPKELMLVPFRLALALQAAGWWVRQTIIWDKPNPMPESVTDRCTQSHEYLFLLTRSERYYFDAAAIRTPLAEKTFTTFGISHAAQGNDALGGVKSDNWGRTVAVRQPKTWKTPAGWDTTTGEGGHTSIHRSGRADKQRGHSRRHAGFNDRWDAMTKAEQQALGANKRSVWTVATEPFTDAHFATFPARLIEPCILAGSRPGDLVLDPFGGSGTTGAVAAHHERDYLLIELNPAYVEMARQRIAEEGRPVVLKRRQRRQMRAAGIQQPSLLDMVEA